MSAPTPTPREHAFESFPEPRTFPKHWDSEAVMRPAQPAFPVQEPPMATFPQPNTIPAGWDTSSMHPDQ